MRSRIPWVGRRMTPEAYDVSGVLPDEALESVPAGTNLAIIGPSMSGKRDLAIELLAVGLEDGDGVVSITTDGRIDVDDFERYADSADRSCVQLLDASGSDGGGARGASQRVSSPSDLTGISIAMAKQLKALPTEQLEGLRYGLVTVSTLLQFLDPQTVFKFLHVYTARVGETDGFGVYTITDDAHDAQTLNTILGQFDAVIRLRENDAGEREAQVRGDGVSPTAWLPFPYGE
jgi:KaiC/GvpD/RAD55 family RecA-like ATPase